MSTPTKIFSFLFPLFVADAHPSLTTFLCHNLHNFALSLPHPSPEPPSLCNTFYLHPSAVPPFFQEEMTSQEGVEGGMVTLHCELSKAPACVQWKKGQHVLTSGTKYSMRQEGCAVELLVHELALSDSGDYSCVCGDQTSTAALTVHGNRILGMSVLQTCPNLCSRGLFCPFLSAWALVFLWTLCVSSLCRIGKNVPCWCLCPSAVLVHLTSLALIQCPGKLGEIFHCVPLTWIRAWYCPMKPLPQDLTQLLFKENSPSLW